MQRFPGNPELFLATTVIPNRISTCNVTLEFHALSSRLRHLFWENKCKSNISKNDSALSSSVNLPSQDTTYWSITKATLCPNSHHLHAMWCTHTWLHFRERRLAHPNEHAWGSGASADTGVAITGVFAHMHINSISRKKLWPILSSPSAACQSSTVLMNSIAFSPWQFYVLLACLTEQQC